MPLTIANASTNWALAGQISAPTSGQQVGAGGPAQANATALIIVNASTSWGIRLLIPTTAQLGATLGPTQGYASSLILVNQTISWNISSRIVQPKVTAQRGAGGATQPNASALIVTGATTSWDLRSRLFAASFTFALSADGFTVLFTSTSGDAPDALSWDFGDGNSGSGTPVSHIYGNIGDFMATLTLTRNRGFERAPLASSSSRTVTIPASAQPDESVDDVLNLEVGRHAYEPLRDQAADVGDNVSFFNEVLNLPAGQLQTLLFFTPARTIRVRQVTATGTGDGLFKLILNSQVIDVKRSYATQRNVRFDIEEGLKLAATDTLEVRVTNSSGLTQSYEGALLGRTL
ncbi:MAG: PKD domain-containing protein [Candidatus Thermoplasmatota archaeon]